MKSASREELLDAVRRTAAGTPVFTSGLAAIVLAPAPPADGAQERPTLTARETEVLRLVAKGLS